VLFFGQIRPYKGLRDLVAAFRHVAARCPDAYLVIAGRPHESPARVHALLAEAGVEGRARTDLRFLPLDPLLELLAASDVEALPHREADQSGAVLLALGMGKPVMSTRAGGIPDVVRDGVNGALVAPGDHRGLADRIVAILSDDELRARLAAGASATSAGLPSWDAIADLTLALYPGSVGAGSAAERSPAPA